MGTIESWFPTTVYYELADQNTKDKIDSEYRKHEAKVIESLSTFTWDDNIETTFKTPDLIQRYELKALHDFIMRCAEEYTGCSGLEIYDSWANYSRRNNFQRVHNHDPKVISGTYYIQTSGDDGDFVLRHVMPVINDGQINYKPEVGKILLFPGWAQHSVNVNKTDSVRISIAFNIREDSLK
jgi:uncharacterized protein (TIGR02466 family)